MAQRVDLRRRRLTQVGAADKALALSTALNPARFPAVELERDEAIRYLRKESLVLPETVERGFVLLTYRQQPLGFVKNLGNRSNNLYPAEWKIRISG